MKSAGLAFLLIFCLLAGTVVGAAMISRPEDDMAGCGPGIAVDVDVNNLPAEAGGYSGEQLVNAAVIAQTAEEGGFGRRGQLIGIMTAIQESDLGRNPAHTQPDENGDAGVMQQRVYDGWYGSLQDVNNISYAARAFFFGVTAESDGDYGSVGGTAKSPFGHIPGLIDIDGWETMPLTIAAAEVQKPHEDYRGYYAKHEGTANEILAAFEASGTTVASTSDGGASDAGGAGCSDGVSTNATGNVKSVIDWAMSWEGKGLTYDLGGGNLEGPTNNTMDCSSFVGSAWNQGAGVTFGRSARDQWSNLSAHRVDPDEIQPGDLIFEAWGTRLDSGTVSHVGMYIGDGQMVEWGRSANGFHVGPARLSGYQFVGVARPPAPDTAPTEGATP